MNIKGPFESFDKLRNRLGPRLLKMAETSLDTKKKLLESAKKEFLEKGFMNASLRTIAANAGVTTGAMYRHFKDKNAFFCALVDDAIEVTKKTVMLAGSDNHADLLTPHKHLKFRPNQMGIYIQRRMFL